VQDAAGFAAARHESAARCRVRRRWRGAAAGERPASRLARALPVPQPASQRVASVPAAWCLGRFWRRAAGAGCCPRAGAGRQAPAKALARPVTGGALARRCPAPSTSSRIQLGCRRPSRRRPCARPSEINLAVQLATGSRRWLCRSSRRPAPGPRRRHRPACTCQATSRPRRCFADVRHLDHVDSHGQDSIARLNASPTPLRAGEVGPLLRVRVRRVQPVTRSIATSSW